MSESSTVPAAGLLGNALEALIEEALELSDEMQLEMVSIYLSQALDLAKPRQ